MILKGYEEYHYNYFINLGLVINYFYAQPPCVHK